MPYLAIGLLLRIETDGLQTASSAPFRQAFITARSAMSGELFGAVALTRLFPSFVALSETEVFFALPAPRSLSTVPPSSTVANPFSRSSSLKDIGQCCMEVRCAGSWPRLHSGVIRLVGSL